MGCGTVAIRARQVNAGSRRAARGLASGLAPSHRDPGSGGNPTPRQKKTGGVGVRTNTNQGARQFQSGNIDNLGGQVERVRVLNSLAGGVRSRCGLGQPKRRLLSQANPLALEHPMNQNHLAVFPNPRHGVALGILVLIGAFVDSAGFAEGPAADPPGKQATPASKKATADKATTGKTTARTSPGKKAKSEMPSSEKTDGWQDAAVSDLAAIRAESQAFVAAFNKKDAKAIAAMWTKEGEYVDDLGRRFLGREAIEQAYAEFFANSPKVKLRVMIDSVRLLGHSTAIEDGRAIVEPPPAGSPAYSKYTAVHVKVDGKWLMASVRDTHVETPSAFRNVADLQWLIGEWVAEEHGVKTESVCRWVANKSFVERKYTMTSVDGTQTSGVQLIGWNPRDGHVQSWSFSPDGGHAVGIWTPQQGGWRAEMHGVTGAGVPTTSVNLLRRLDHNAYVWQSAQRTAGDAAVPDTDEVIMKRQSAGK